MNGEPREIPGDPSRTVRLEPITEANVRAVFDLRVTPEQEAFVASNAWSLAQALAEYDNAWPRAIVADDEVVGFLMLEMTRTTRMGVASGCGG